MAEYIPLLSIVIPIYNSEKYLNECLDSVISQDFTNYELLCIDDGSMDQSWSILQKYEKKYSQIRIFHKENGGGGAGSARNYGVNKARGKYIFFMDSDDYLLKNNALSIMIDHMEKKDLDLFLFDGTSKIEKSKNEMKHLDYYKSAYRRKKAYGLYEKGYQMFSQMVKNRDYFSVVYLQCIRSELIHKNNMIFNVRTVNEDTSYTFETFLLANRIEHVAEPLLVRRIHPDSLMQQEHKFYLHIYKLFLEWRRMIDFWKCHDFPDEIQEDILKIVSQLEKRIKKMYQNLSSDEEQRKIKEIPVSDRYVLEKLLFNGGAQKTTSFVVPYHLLPCGTKIVIYGAGKVGQEFYRKIAIDGYWSLVGMVDRQLEGGGVEPVSKLKEWKYDRVIIAIKDSSIAQVAKKQILNMGISQDKVLWCGDIYDRDDFYKKYYLNKLCDGFYQR
ncbi:glycosyltransferase family 2 protein [Selenomonas ruminantium]|uniref:glycosyltransferase family 2 protein n=1 Tax=Selenomonas ruminantium TaxID=971 RepID=UPI00040679A9|nr:glycosyltransferase family 2 protein [Selenomonas ruminantium]